MDRIANPDVVHAGTLNGNPLALAVAKAALDALSANSSTIYPELRRLGGKLQFGLEQLLRSRGLPAVGTGEGGVFHISFQSRRPRDYRDTLAANGALCSDFCLALLDEGIFVLPDGRWYLSAVHSEEDIEATLAAAERILA